MTVTDQIDDYIGSQPEPKRADMENLHRLITQILPGTKLRFDDGTNSDGKAVSNPSIGYGNYTIKYANGTTRDFFQIGMSANTTGISIYILGIADKTYLTQTYGKQLGKASVTGYCIKFKKLEDIDLHTLEAAIRDGVKISGEN
ncbi:hypothetical protein A0256_21900 [Mucilaginibacter sp. PAMC 26640]|nr:hypothetical protein A0256_21900 [Mucilaginibacter sp. PAMC 26640]